MKEHYIIIGGTSGIGKALATSLSNKGKDVITVSRRETGLSGIDHISLDILNDDLSSYLPEGIIKGIAYCPGSINLKPFRGLKIENFTADLNINFLGAVRAIQAVLPRMDRESGSSIVLFSTVAVQLGMPFHTSISAAKGAIEGFTRSLAAELSPSIRVNCIAPSLTDTPLAERLVSNEAKRKASSDRHPLKRIGTPEEIAALAEFCLTQQSAWITGQIMHVDGGMSAVRL